MPRRKIPEGRSTQSFVMLEKYLLFSPAWKSLSIAAKAAFPYLRARFMGSNNGRISMSVRELAAECAVDKNTASRVLRELQAKGFIKLARRGAYSPSHRHASEWILTMLPYNDELPTKDFMRWRKYNDYPVPFIQTDCMKRPDQASEFLGSPYGNSVPSLGTRAH